MKTKKEVKPLILDAVWKREIDQISTREVAEKFDCSLQTARAILLSIVNGESGDTRFIKTEEGVTISDGSTFNYSPMDVNGEMSFNGIPKHYIWFAF